MSGPRDNNTSASGGFLPLSPVPRQTAMEKVLQSLITGITGICGELARPRWQPEPPREPGPDVNWCAFGITGYEPLNFPEIRHHGEGEGHDEIVDHETLTVLASFYGPGHADLARLLRRGLHVPQNRSILRPAGLVFVRAGSIVPVPALAAMQWRARADLTLFFGLETRGAFPSLNLLQTGGSVRSDSSGAASTETGRDGGLETPLGCRACSRDCRRE